MSIGSGSPASFSKGDRVLVSPEYHWAKGVSGEVDFPPDPVLSITPGWDGCSRWVPARGRDLLFIWVRFDTPQVDGDGDGPYFAGEIDSRYLRHGQ
jgi:hypothetical protein